LDKPGSVENWKVVPNPWVPNDAEKGGGHGSHTHPITLFAARTEVSAGILVRYKQTLPHVLVIAYNAAQRLTDNSLMPTKNEPVAPMAKKEPGSVDNPSSKYPRITFTH